MSSFASAAVAAWRELLETRRCGIAWRAHELAAVTRDSPSRNVAPRSRAPGGGSADCRRDSHSSRKTRSADRRAVRILRRGCDPLIQGALLESA